MTQQTIYLMDKSIILRLNCNCSGTPNCNLVVGESPPAVGKTPVGKTPMGKTPVGKTPRSLPAVDFCIHVGKILGSIDNIDPRSDHLP